MKISLQKLIDSVQAFRELQQVSLPATVSFRLSKLVKAADEHLEDFSNQRKALAEKESSPEEKNKELKELLDLEVDLPDTRLSISDFGDAKITPAALSALEWLIKE